MENYHGEMESSDSQPNLSTSDATAPMELKTMEQKRELILKRPYVVSLVYASWCGPCQQFKPQFANYARDNVSKAYFAQENIDLRLSDGVRSIPTMVVYKNGNVIERIVGPDLKRLDEILPPV
jgi:thioredoxin 1